MKLNVLVVAGLFLISGGLCAQTPDGQTPADEDVCDVYSGKAFGLCNAYCEALDCDSWESQNYEEMACARLLSRFETLTGQGLPICVDMDSDGVTNSEDNCPDTANPGQEDADADGVGDVCDNCVHDFNPGQEDQDSNGIGDACEVQEAACLCWDEDLFRNTYPPTATPDHNWAHACTAGYQGTIVLENDDKPDGYVSFGIFQAVVTTRSFPGTVNGCYFSNYKPDLNPDLPAYSSETNLTDAEVDACVESIKRQARAHAVPGVVWDCWPE
jgi:hypothetical protein